MFKIEKAKREGAKIVIGLAGTSGSGKTYTALQLGYGLALKQGSKLGFLDTENRRGRLYANLFKDDPFLIADFYAPFSPERYIDGIKAFEDAGVEVLVIDSGSHEFEGIGGLEEIANAGNPKVPNWNKAKSRHKLFMNVLLQSSMHIIICFRAREKVALGKDEQGKTVFIPQGLMPITEKNVMFEMTASLMMDDAGKKQTAIKSFNPIKKHLHRGNGFITVEDGVAIRKWIDGGGEINKEIERHRAILQNTCEQGTLALRAAWELLSNEVKFELKDDLDSLKASAKAYDELQSKIDTSLPENPLV